MNGLATTRVTITDVARAANVHASTVSRVLNGRAELSLLPETRERVIAAATRLGYRPSALARGLRLRRTFTLGMLVPDITNPVFPSIIKGVEGAAHTRGYHLILCNTDDSFEREASYLRVLREWRVDGILIASSSTADSTIAELRREKVPFVLLEQRVSRERRPRRGAGQPPGRGRCHRAPDPARPSSHRSGRGAADDDGGTGATPCRARDPPTSPPRARGRARRGRGLVLRGVGLPRRAATPAGRGAADGDLLRQRSHRARGDPLCAGDRARRSRTISRSSASTTSRSPSSSILRSRRSTSRRRRWVSLRRRSSSMQLEGRHIARRHVVLETELVVRGSTAAATRDRRRPR